MLEKMTTNSLTDRVISWYIFGADAARRTENAKACLSSSPVASIIKFYALDVRWGVEHS